MNELNWQTEGKAVFQIGNAFYRPHGQMARDLGVLAAAVHRVEIGHLRVLDCMSGSGVRSLRYNLESQADWVWANDSNPDIGTVLRENLERSLPVPFKVTHQDAKRVFLECCDRQDLYDLVDLDCFGSPAPYLSFCLGAVAIGGLLYVTSTDGRTTTGHAPDACLALYGSYARSHPAAHEQGLRILIGSIQQTAAAQGLGVEPVFSLFLGETYRVMLRLVARPLLDSQNYGLLGYCHRCGDYQTVSWRDMGRVNCAHDGHWLTIGGAMWLGALHNAKQLHKFANLAERWQWSKQSALLALMAEESDLPPYFYTLGEIGKRGKLDIPKRSRLIKTLQTIGYRACASHVNAQAIKTTATIQTCIEAARQSQVNKSSHSAQTR